MSFTAVYLALGSNQGDRRALLTAGINDLLEHGVEISARSSIYETDAVADHPQPPYLNQVVCGRTRLSPRALLAMCLEIERNHGRTRDPALPKAARTLDIDILLYGDRVIRDPALTIPHPAMLERGFVRIPLAEIATPGLRHPVTRQRLDSAPPDATVRLVASDGR
ncbi:MAG: 2-amino-4-hydroxy-6-hydroxymethyldihydropteridine diphosphokinase [Myxococcales bacterium]|nr:2-amino-4-hydroxy-6-hydroxymethyldihydropteridine diphosphokinase [Myxococcales bacterium]